MIASIALLLVVTLAVWIVNLAFIYWIFQPEISFPNFSVQWRPSTSQLRKWLEHPDTWDRIVNWVALFFLLLGLFGLFFEYICNLSATCRETDPAFLWYVWYSMSSELTGIGVTIFFIDQLVQIRATVQEKQRLIAQMGSPSNELAKDAVRQVSDKRWLTDGSLRNVNLNRANLDNAYLLGADLEGANLVQAKLGNVRLTKANLKNTDLFGVVAPKMWCGGADLTGAMLDSAQLEHAQMGSINLTNASLAQANLHGANLNGAVLRGADLRFAILTNVSFVGADLTKADLSHADLEGANLTGANFENTILIGTNLHNTRVKNASFRMAVSDWLTVWPEDITPQGSVFIHGTHEELS